MRKKEGDKGDKGDKGEKGEKGENGEKGEKVRKSIQGSFLRDVAYAKCNDEETTDLKKRNVFFLDALSPHRFLPPP